ncbi:MAG: TdeIII family type II restriction endonuclease [Methermicoccaceae archaeon]
MEKEVEIQIEQYLNGFLQGLVNKYDPKVVRDEVLQEALFSDEKGEYKPFHAALIPPELLRLQSFFRSFSTSLGQGVFEYIAKLVAEANPRWRDVKANYAFKANASPAVQSAVDTFLEDVISRRVPPFPTPAFPEPNSQFIKEVVVDLSFKSRDGDLYFIEIKSPKPNKDQTRRTKEKFLFLLATYPNARAYYAFAYNPYGELKQSYRWSFTRQFFDLEREVLMGKQFWDFVGGKDTYEAILNVFEKVGREKGREITRRLIEHTG